MTIATYIDTSKRHTLFRLGVAIVCCAVGIYGLLLYFGPKLPRIPVISSTAIDLNTADDRTDTRNRIQIAKLHIEVPFFVGGSETLERGAWHRQPQNGDPASGGNFVLAAHRFELGYSPANTKLKSPFYAIDKLADGDMMRVFYEGKWYDYRVTRLYEVPPTALEIEHRSMAPKLTLYSCSLGGAAAGRYVVEATPVP